MMAPERFDAGPLLARRLTAQDLAFVQHLMAHPQMHGHKPDPTPPTPDHIAQSHADDLAHWTAHGVGRYLVQQRDRAIGLCGLTQRAGFPGLNLSYHLHPEAWGKGLASVLAAGLVEMADRALPVSYLHGLARGGNPASTRVLDKAGFIRAATVQLCGADSQLWIRALRDAEPILYYGGAWRPLVLQTSEGFILEVPVDLGHLEVHLRLPADASDLAVLHRSVDRAHLAYAALHPLGQTQRRATPEMSEVLRRTLHAPEAVLTRWLKAHDRRHHGAVSNMAALAAGADLAKIREGHWLPLPRTKP